MTIRSLFDVTLKVLGIYLVKDALLAIPQLALQLRMFFDKEQYPNAGLGLAYTLITLLVYIVFIYCLIFKTKAIIDACKLDKGFEEQDLSLNLHRSTILSISIIVMGGVIVALDVPSFIDQLVEYFRERKQMFGETKPNISYLILFGSKIVIGLLLIGNQKMIVNFIEKRRRS